MSILPGKTNELKRFIHPTFREFIVPLLFRATQKINNTLSFPYKKKLLFKLLAELLSQLLAKLLAQLLLNHLSRVVFSDTILCVIG